PARAGRLVERDVPLEADATERGDEVAAALELLRRAVEVAGRREDHVLRRRPQLGIDQVEETALELALEAVRMVEVERAALPVEPRVHAEEADVVERQPLGVHTFGEERVLAGRPERDDQRNLVPGRSCGRDLLPDVLGEHAVDVGRRLDELERNSRPRLELLDGYGDPLVQLGCAVQAPPPSGFCFSGTNTITAGRRQGPTSCDT